MKTHMKYNCDIRGNWVRVPSDPVTVNRSDVQESIVSKDMRRSTKR